MVAPRRIHTLPISHCDSPSCHTCSVRQPRPMGRVLHSVALRSGPALGMKRRRRRPGPARRARPCPNEPPQQAAARVRQDAARPYRPGRLWPRGSTRPARTSPARPTAPSRYCARRCVRPRSGVCASAAPTPALASPRTPRNHLARFLDADELTRFGRALDTGEAEWPEAVAAIRLLALTGCRRSEVLNLRWRDMGEDAHQSRGLQDRPARGGRSARRRGRSSRRCPARARQMRFCSRATPGAGANGASRTAGGRSAPMPSSAGCACTICATRRPARRSMAGREPAAGRQTARSQPDRDHRAVMPTWRAIPIQEAAERVAGSIAADIL